MARLGLSLSQGRLQVRQREGAVRCGTCGDRVEEGEGEWGGVWVVPAPATACSLRTWAGGGGARSEDGLSPHAHGVLWVRAMTGHHLLAQAGGMRGVGPWPQQRGLLRHLKHHRDGGAWEGGRTRGGQDGAGGDGHIAIAAHTRNLHRVPLRRRVTAGGLAERHRGCRGVAGQLDRSRFINGVRRRPRAGGAGHGGGLDGSVRDAALKGVTAAAVVEHVGGGRRKRGRDGVRPRPNFRWCRAAPRLPRAQRRFGAAGRSRTPPAPVRRGGPRECGA